MRRFAALSLLSLLLLVSGCGNGAGGVGSADAWNSNEAFQETGVQETTIKDTGPQDVLAEYAVGEDVARENTLGPDAMKDVILSDALAPDSGYINSLLCLPCKSSLECEGEDDSDGLCVTQDAPAGFFCGISCVVGDGCPPGYSCQAAVSIEGITAMQCVPELGLCVCSAEAVAAALSTACQKSNEWGVCEGVRVCGVSGLTDCDAAEPAEDVCNAVDDNCDGQMDEDTCDDSNPCTSDVCLGAEGCSNDPIANVECADGNLCTTGDHCEAGVCTGVAVDCDDGNPCTQDSCKDGEGCSHSPAGTDGLACADADACTVGDKCEGGVCIAGTEALECNDQNPCTDDGCNSLIGCIFVNTGSPCTDGNACTDGDVCSQGSCIPGPARICPDDGNPCTETWCDSGTGCLTEPLPDSTECENEGDPCSIDACLGGFCYHIANLCDDGNPCTDDYCDSEKAECSVTFNSNLCNDGNPCTTADKCGEGACQGGGTLNCNDKNPCTTDTCNPLIGCVFTPNQAQCSDNNKCTTGDHCADGKCITTGLFDCDDGNVCTIEACLPKNGGVCEKLAVSTDGNPCDDGDDCTLTDACNGGTCLGSIVTNCNDKNECTQDVCLPGGGCSNEPSPGTCSDADACTTGDHCSDGECMSSGALDCNDGNFCTDDSCVPLLGCTHSNNTLPCPDSEQVCVSGTCQIPRPSEPGQVLITEFMAKSQTGTDNGEWLELHNTTTHTFDLKDCILRDFGSDKHVINAPLTIAATGFIAMAKSMDPMLNHGLSPDYVYATFTLSNTDDEIQLECGGVVIDTVAYLDAEKISTGAAAQLDPANFDHIANDDMNNWCFATATYGSEGMHGTPGEPNSLCPSP